MYLLRNHPDCGGCSEKYKGTPIFLATPAKMDMNSYMCSEPPTRRNGYQFLYVPSLFCSHKISLVLTRLGDWCLVVIGERCSCHPSYKNNNLGAMMRNSSRAVSLTNFIKVIEKAAREHRPFEVHTLAFLFDVSTSFFEQLNPDKLVPLQEAINSHIQPHVVTDLGNTEGQHWSNRFTNLLSEYMPPIIQE